MIKFTEMTQMSWSTVEIYARLLTHSPHYLISQSLIEATCQMVVFNLLSVTVPHFSVTTLTETTQPSELASHCWQLVANTMYGIWNGAYSYTTWFNRMQSCPKSVQKTLIPSQSWFRRIIRLKLASIIVSE